jgi:nucleoside 2-deoxyribosyltransferase
MPIQKAVDIFVSSTCYDLIDVRQEIHNLLTTQKFIVRLSDAADSDFEVNPSANSIQSCLDNVERADAVVCIIDRRYGGILPTGGAYSGISATHAEVKYARAKGRPVFFFMREEAKRDYEAMRANPAADVRCIEPEKPDAVQYGLRS